MNLREQAAFAYRDRIAAEEQDIIDRCTRILRDTLRPYDADDIEVVLAAPAASPPYCELTTGGLTFKVSITTTTRTQAAGQTNSGMQWEEIENKVCVRRAGSDCPIKDLADLGKVFDHDPLPEPAEVDEPEAMGV